MTEKQKAKIEALAEKKISFEIDPNETLEWNDSRKREKEKRRKDFKAGAEAILNNPSEYLDCAVWVKVGSENNLPQINEDKPYVCELKTGNISSMWYNGESSNNRWLAIVNKWLCENKEVEDLPKGNVMYADADLFKEKEQENAQLKAEIERLKGLLINCSWEEWQQFKTENNV